VWTGDYEAPVLVAGLRMTCMVALMVLDGPINGDWFEICGTQVLIQELQPGDVVIMDNLSSHKRASVRERIEAAGATQGWLDKTAQRDKWIFCLTSARLTCCKFTTFFANS